MSGLTVLKCKSKIVGLETSLESVFGLDGSEFGWQCIPYCWSSKRKRSFGELGSGTWFDEDVTSEEHRLERVTVSLTCCTSSCR